MAGVVAGVVGDGARGARAADEPRVRDRGGRRSPAARCSCRSCPRSRAWPASTSSASTRPARSPRGSSSSTGSRCSTGRRRRRLTAALGALADDEERQRDPGRARRGVPGPDGWDARPARCRSRRRASGARRASTGTAPGCSARPRWCGLDAADDPVRRTADELAADGQPGAAARAAPTALAGEELPPGLDRGRARAVRGEDPARRGRHARVLPRPGRRAQGHLGRQPAHGRRGRRAGSGCPDADEPVDARELPEDLDALADVLEDHVGVRPGHAAPEARDRRRAAVARPRRRDDRRRRERRARAQGRRHRHRDGQRCARRRARSRSSCCSTAGSRRMPGVVAEGRRVIANIERVANLFVTKTVYAMLLAIAVGVARWPYPFLPRHLTIVSTLTIGIPAFFLALAPNTRRYVPGLRPPRAALRDPGRVRRGRRDVGVAYAIAHAAGREPRRGAHDGDARAAGRRPLGAERSSPGRSRRSGRCSCGAMVGAVRRGARAPVRARLLRAQHPADRRPR